MGYHFTLFCDSLVNLETLSTAPLRAIRVELVLVRRCLLRVRCSTQLSYTSEEDQLWCGGDEIAGL
jgi:hypothetical protein